MSGSPNAASVAIFSGEGVLLIQRAHHPFRGYWTLPGGRIEQGETALDCARREIDEELGLALDLLVPVTTLAMQTSPAYILAVFATRLSGGVPTASDEILDWHWISPKEISNLRTTPNLDEVISKANEALTPV